jgi:hypothetical protein
LDHLNTRVRTPGSLFKLARLADKTADSVAALKECRDKASSNVSRCPSDKYFGGFIDLRT